MRALVIGDIHTEAELLAQAIEHGTAEGVDKVLAVGDIVDGPGDPVACIDQLRACGADVVRGNHERWVNQGHPLEAFDYPAEALEWLNELPSTREYDTPTGRLILCHAIGTNDMLRLEPDTDGYALECLDPLWKLVDTGRYRWMIGGHTHIPMVRTLRGLTVINPGTLVLVQDPGFMIVDLARATVEHWGLLPALIRIRTWELAA